MQSLGNRCTPGQRAALAETCTLDVAGRGGLTLKQIAAIMNLTAQRVSQLELLIASKLRELVATLPELIDEFGGEKAKLRLPLLEGFDQPRGFAALDRETVCELARSGAESAQASGKRHQFTRDEQRAGATKSTLVRRDR